jgi:hypothetical protein
MKTAATITAVLLALTGLVAGAAGAILLGLFDSDGRVASGTHSISSEQRALVSSVADLSDVSDLDDLVGDPRILLTARSADRVFIGIGPARQVERYLASVAIDEVTDFEIDPFRLEREPRAGSRRPASPARQTFWVAQATGHEAKLHWKVRDGDYRLVLMNADGRAGVDVDADVALRLPKVGGLAWGLVAGGGLLLVAGLGGVVLVTRSRRPVAA